MALAYLLLGGNLDDRLSIIEQAKRFIDRSVGNISGMSSVYETEPWGFTHENLFLNQVIAVNTTLPPHELLRETQTIETRLGRTTKGIRYEGRTIDIDVLFYNEAIIHAPDLQIPHPRLHLRRFTLEPLAELAPRLIHPFFLLTTKELLASCRDRSGVYPMAVPVYPV